MTTALTVLALLIAFYRYRKGLFTRLEWLILAFWVIHAALEFGQLFFDLKSFHFEIRFFQPTDFMTWGWLAWGVVHWWHRVRTLACVLLAAIIAYDIVMLVKPRLPVGRRGAYADACEWAAERIRTDWKGPRADRERIFSIREYHQSARPVVDAFSARVPYLAGGRLDMGEPDFKKVDAPDYWIHDISREDPPKSGYRFMDSFKRGRYEIHLYRRNTEK